MKYLSIFFLFAIGCSSVAKTNKTIKNNDVFYYNFQNRKIKYFNHVERKRKPFIFPYEKKEFPKIISKKNNKIIVKAQKLYNQKKFHESAALFNKIFKEENNNLLYLQLLARSIFWMPNGNRKFCFKLYRYIVRSIDFRSPEFICLDLWYMDSYWKLGCLYLDFQKYKKAAHEICKAMACGMIEYGKVYKQALSFLAECYYFMNKHEYVLYLFLYTKSIFREADYIKKYLDKTKFRRSKNISGAI